MAIARPLGLSPSASFLNQSDYAYFRFFREHSTRILAGPYRDNLWERVILQACHEEPSIRALAASIGALELSISSSGGSASDLLLLEWPHAPARATRAAGSHYSYALEQYGKGLTEIRRVTESQKPDAARHALIGAILIYCFESIYDGPETAIPHFEKALCFINTELARLGQSYRHLTTSSPALDLGLGDELVAAFVRLEGGLISRPSAFISNRMPQFLVTCDFSNDYLPPSFSSIDQARNYLEQAQFSHMPEIIRSWGKATRPGGLLLSDEVLDVARQTSARVAQWIAAFSPIFERALASHARGGPFSGEFALQLQALMANLTAQVFWSAADDADEHHAHEHQAHRRDLAADCDAINALSREIAAEPGFQRTFVWNNSILQALITVVTAAPKLSTRIEALEILKSVRPRREGAYDSIALVEAGEFALQVVTDQNVCGKVSSKHFYINTYVEEEDQSWWGEGLFYV